MSFANLPAASRDTKRPIAERVEAIITELTLEEKVSQMLHAAPAIVRLGIPAYNWWNECSHGVARAGEATVFPHAIGIAATWDQERVRRVYEVVAEEARAKHHDAARQGNRDIYFGLTFWTPNINIVRDPRWGRIQETFGEDPYLTGTLAVTLIKALQGDDPKYYKAAACAKHYAVHSGPEALRHEFDAQATAYDMWDTYLPAFEMCVREGGVEAFMGAYNRTNGEACCASPTLLQEILRERWGFEGHVVSDCWAIRDIYQHHKLVDTPEAAAALAVQAGCDLNCGSVYDSLLNAVNQGLIEESTLDVSLRRLFTCRFKLGFFDPLDDQPYTQIPLSVVNAPEHRTAALDTAHASIVLLKNANHTLPLDKSIESVAVIGPNADNEDAQLGNYRGTPVDPVTVYGGIKAALPDARVRYSQGCHLYKEDRSGFAGAGALANASDVVVFVGGLSQLLEGEEGQHESVPEGEVSQGDRSTIELPAIQEELLKVLHATGKPVILVLLGGGTIAIPWADENLPAILQAWYPGQAADAVADVLVGDFNPAGRLPMTVYRATSDLPDFEDYTMTGRTYRYFEGTPLYPFGYGLSYTSFSYSDLKLSADTISAGEGLRVEVSVRNSGDRAGDEVVQLYLRHLDAPKPAPLHALHGFRRVHMDVGQTETVVFELDHAAFELIDDAGERVLRPGRCQIFVGGGQPDTGAVTVNAMVTLG